MDNDDQIAAVMGHEVVHVLRDHGQQRVARATSTQLGVALAGAAIGAGGGDAGAWTQVLGLGAQVRNALPFSRDHELEADRLGLRLMAAAGYDPYESIEFWRKMEARKDGSPPESLSTHPSGGRRIEQLRQKIEEMRAGA